ncbi:MAG TPA: PaaI family thioesterase [Methanothrix sp.]|nr:PaaI family thioesterase [Methanothrix sp.]
MSWALTATAKQSFSCRCGPTCTTAWDGCKGAFLPLFAMKAMALALFTVLEEGVGIATISESTSFLQGVRSGRIRATGKVVKRGRSIAFMGGHVQSEDGTTLTETRASFAIMPNRQKD